MQKLKIVILCLSCAASKIYVNLAYGIDGINIKLIEVTVLYFVDRLVVVMFPSCSDILILVEINCSMFGFVNRKFLKLSWVDLMVNQTLK